MNVIQSELGEVTMLFHCCSIPSPRALVQDPPEIRHTIDLTILSHFWVNIRMINNLLINFYVKIFF